MRSQGYDGSVDDLIDPNVACLPSWHNRFAPLGDGRQWVVTSGCGVTSAGNVSCEPEALRSAAEKILRSWGYLPLWQRLPLTEYTLARYMASEMGSGTVEERAAIGMAAINRVRLEKLRDVNQLLLYRQGSGHPNRGYYGPIHGEGGASTAPYGRWAATSRDPALVDLLIAHMLLTEGDHGWARRADDQANLTNRSAFANPEATVRRFAESRSYWIGPLPGVDHRRTFLFTRRSQIDPNSEAGRYLTARGVAGVTAPSPDWSGLPVCSDRGWLYASIAGLVSIGLSMALSGHARRS